MKKKVLLGVIAALTLAFVAACGRHETPVSRFYGTSFKLAGEAQLHNPDAGIKDGTPSGLDGRVAQKVINRYEKSFETEAPKTNTYSVVFQGMKMK